MKKLINATDTALAESLDGFAASHADIVILGEDPAAQIEDRQAGVQR